MGTYEALQELRKAIARHSQLFRQAWHDNQWSEAEEHWKHLLVLRSEDDRIARRKNNS